MRSKSVISRGVWTRTFLEAKARSLFTIINSCHSPIRGQRVHAIQSIQCNYMEPSQMLSAMRRISVLASVICLEKLSIVWVSSEDWFFLRYEHNIICFPVWIVYRQTALMWSIIIKTAHTFTFCMDHWKFHYNINGPYQCCLSVNYPYGETDDVVFPVRVFPILPQK